jgi:hypothetical protein
MQRNVYYYAAIKTLVNSMKTSFDERFAVSVVFKNYCALWPCAACQVQT